MKKIPHKTKIFDSVFLEEIIIKYEILFGVHNGFSPQEEAMKYTHSRNSFSFLYFRRAKKILISHYIVYIVCESYFSILYRYNCICCCTFLYLFLWFFHDNKKICAHFIRRTTKKINIDQFFIFLFSIFPSTKHCGFDGNPSLMEIPFNPKTHRRMAVSLTWCSCLLVFVSWRTFRTLLEKFKSHFFKIICCIDHLSLNRILNVTSNALISSGNRWFPHSHFNFQFQPSLIVHFWIFIAGPII